MSEAIDCPYDNHDCPDFRGRDDYHYGACMASGDTCPCVSDEFVNILLDQ